MNEGNREVECEVERMGKRHVPGTELLLEDLLLTGAGPAVLDNRRRECAVGEKEVRQLFGKVSWNVTNLVLDVRGLDTRVGRTEQAALGTEHSCGWTPSPLPHAAHRSSSHLDS
jgi:hypothetical protein